MIRIMIVALIKTTDLDINRTYICMHDLSIARSLVNRIICDLFEDKGINHLHYRED